jgi:hypothetical protein
MGAGRDRGQAVPVTVIAAAQKDVPIQLRAIGNVEPYSTAESGDDGVRREKARRASG